MRITELYIKTEDPIVNYYFVPKQSYVKINAETSDLHPIVMCTSKRENVHPFFSIRHRSHHDTSLVTKLQGENTGVLSQHGPHCMRP